MNYGQKLMKNIVGFAILFFCTGCAHTFMRGSVAEKINLNKAVVCLGDNDVKVGDTVKFQRSICSWTKFPSNPGIHEITEVGSTVEHTGEGQYRCELINLGSGKVIDLVNDHFSIVETNGSFVFDESTQIEVVR